MVQEFRARSLTSGQIIEAGDMRRTLCLIVSLLGHMTGALRRETRDAWYAATELPPDDKLIKRFQASYVAA